MATRATPGKHSTDLVARWHAATPDIFGTTHYDVAIKNSQGDQPGVQLEKIPASEHKSMLENFWLMLMMLESKGSSALDRQVVEQLYNQWNRITGDNKQPVWKQS